MISRSVEAYVEVVASVFHKDVANSFAEDDSAKIVKSTFYSILLIFSIISFVFA